jgi:hypothetical protein
MKQLFIALALVVLFVAPMFAQGSVEVPTQQIQMGTWASSGSSLSNGTGDREMSVAVSFPKGFKVKPDVMVAITMIDADKSDNVRVNVTAEGAGRDGFTVKIKTWAGSKVNGVSGTWIAVAPATATVKVK